MIDCTILHHLCRASTVHTLMQMNDLLIQCAHISEVILEVFQSVSSSDVRCEYLHPVVVSHQLHCRPPTNTATTSQ